MNKNNIWIHLGLAIVFIGMAAVFGQLKVWQNSHQYQEVRSIAVKEAKNEIVVKKTFNAGRPEVLVKFRPDVKLSEIKKILASKNDRLEDEIENVKNLVSIDDLDNADANTVAKMYRSMKDLVVYAEPNYQINLNPLTSRKVSGDHFSSYDDKASAPNDPMFKEQWALNNEGQNGGKAKAHLDVLKAWIKNKGNKDVVIAVLDTGVDYNHKDLVKNMWKRPANIPAYVDDEIGKVNDINGFNADANSGDPMDQNGHGTHCAGVIGAEGNNGIGISGINWKVEIMALKFLGRGGFGSTKNAIESINYAIDRKKAGVNIRVINASWGATQYSKALEDAIKAAGENGILFVAAAGNASTDNDRRPHYPSNYDLPNVISVAALDRNDAMASFSNYGAKTVHVAAPGKDIVSTWLKDGFREASGTSMATPQVAGVAGLIVSSNPKIKVETLRKKLLNSVDKIDSLDGKLENAGRVNAALALTE